MGGYKPQTQKEDDDMASSMTPSSMTSGQIDRACEIFRAQLLKHAAQLPSDAVQQAFGQSDLGPEWLAVLRKRTEAFTMTFVEEIDYNNPRWNRIDSSQYAHIEDITVENLPNLEIGKKSIGFREFSFEHQPSDEEILERFNKEDCRQPTRAEVETIIRKRYTLKQLAKNPVIGLIGPVIQRNGFLDRACVYGYGAGVALIWHWTNNRWFRRYRFIAVCKTD